MLGCVMVWRAFMVRDGVACTYSHLLAHPTQALTNQIKKSVESGERLHHELSLTVKDFVRDEDSLTYAILPKVSLLKGV